MLGPTRELCSLKNAAPPGDGRFRRLMRLDQLPDVVFQQFVGHAEAAAVIQHSLARKKQ
jgi:hypothetical protein